MGWHHEWMNGLGGFMFPGFGFILVIVLVVVVIWLLAAGRSGGSAGGDARREQPPSETPLDILKRRYAKGEITKEEYDRIKRDLES